MKCRHYQTKPLTIRIIHWVIAILISTALITGYAAFDFTWTANGFFSRDLLFIIHRSSGLIVAILFLLWLALRFPKLWKSRPNSLWSWLVATSHIAIGCLGFIIPLLAWIGRGVGGRTEEMFSLLPVYNLVSKSESALPYIILDWHKSLIPLLLILITIHIVATLVHYFYIGDNLFHSMLFNGLSNKKTEWFK
jgi:cytochrome b561